MKRTNEIPYGQSLPTFVPPKSLQRPKRIVVRVGGRKKRTLHYHVFGKRPKRGDKVRIRDGLYAGELGTVKRRRAPFYRGYTYLAEAARPKGWSE